ncbi:CoA transferase [Streptomyces sp. NPDC046805]|uniref:CoA transferase n=1 Tax=Streptomyces sp. NPDC046805 TaxID=3155134 RepID=UPI0033D32AC0
MDHRRACDRQAGHGETDERYATRRARVRHHAEVRAALAKWFATQTARQVVGIFGGKVSIGPLYTATDNFAALTCLCSRDARAGRAAGGRRSASTTSTGSSPTGQVAAHRQRGPAAQGAAARSTAQVGPADGAPHHGPRRDRSTSSRAPAVTRPGAVTHHTTEPSRSRRGVPRFNSQPASGPTRPSMSCP